MDCAACGIPLTSVNRGGDVQVFLILKPSGKVGLSLPICLSCNDEAATSPEAGFSVLRRAAPRALRVERSV